MAVLDDEDKKWLRRNFLSKSDADSFLTRSDEDIQAIKDLMVETINEKVEDGTIASGKDIKNLPTKEEFYESQDKLMKEIKASREENAAYASQVKRLATKVERHHPSN